MTDAVLFDARADGIAILTINRPEQRNALSREVREGLRAAWARFEADDGLRVAILTGSGEKAFCAGGDLKEMVETGMQVPPRDMFPLPYDNIELTKYTSPSLTTIAQDKVKIGREAAKHLIALINHEAESVPGIVKRVPVELVIRESTK